MVAYRSDQHPKALGRIEDTGVDPNRRIAQGAIGGGVSGGYVLGFADTRAEHDNRLAGAREMVQASASFVAHTWSSIR